MNSTFPKYIHSTPEGEDLFVGKSHERIAQSIGNIIYNDSLKPHDTDESKIIGLEGDWGSGKSKIIQLLSDHLKKSHHVFTYDSWAHQEDSQRRAFLEKLTVELCDNKIVKDKAKWVKQKNHLLSQTKHTDKTVIPRLNDPLIIVIVALIITPLIGWMFSIIGDSKEGISMKIVFSISLLTGIIFLYTYDYIRSKCFNKQRQWPRVEQLYYVFKGNSLEENSIEKTINIEPTVLDFIGWMEDISASLKETKKLVVVFDNMDRLPAHKVEALWSSIYSFFSSRSYENIWVIIPFDRKHLQKTVVKSVDVMAEESKQETANNDIDDFITKTFPILFDVPKPILKDWREFFRIKYNEAFGESSTKEFQDVIGIYSILCKKTSPREIITFMNGIVSLKMVWENVIPTKYLVAYYLKKDEIHKDLYGNVATNTSYKEVAHYFHNDTNFQNYIAAIAYNVSVEDACFIMLMEEMKKQDNNSLKEWVSKNIQHSHFYHVLDSYLGVHESNLDRKIEILNATTDCESELKNRDNLFRLWDITTAEYINLASNNDDSINLNVFKFSTIHECMLKHSSNTIKKGLIDVLYKHSLNYLTHNPGIYFIFHRDLEEFTLNNLDITYVLGYKDHFIDPDKYIKYIEVAKTDYTKFGIKTDPAKLDRYLSDNIEMLFNYSTILDILKNDSQFSLTELESSFNKKYDNIESHNYFKQFIHCYKKIALNLPIKILQIRILSTFIIKYESEHKTSHPDLIAQRLIWNTEFSKNNAYDGHHIDIAMQKDHDDFIIDEISSCILFYITKKELFEIALRWESPLLIKVCSKLITPSLNAEERELAKQLSEKYNLPNSSKLFTLL